MLEVFPEHSQIQRIEKEIPISEATYTKQINTVVSLWRSERLRFIHCVYCFSLSLLWVLIVFTPPHCRNSCPKALITFTKQALSTRKPFYFFPLFSRHLIILFGSQIGKIINGWFIPMDKMTWSGFHSLTEWSEWNCVPLINCDEMLFVGWIKLEVRRNHCGLQDASSAVSHFLAFDHIILSVLIILDSVVCY